MSDILLKNGHLVDPVNNIDGVCDIIIKNGTVEKVDKGIKAVKAKGIDKELKKKWMGQ